MTAVVAAARVLLRRAGPPMTLFGAIGLVLVALNVVLAIAGPLLAPHTMSAIGGGGAFASPSPAALLGNDYLGRDLLSRLLYGARLSLGVATAATALGFLIGVSIGLAAAEVGGWLDTAVTWAIDVLLSLPPLLLALLVVTGLGSSLAVLIGVIAFVQTPRVARVSRSVAMGVSALEFVEAARARGESLPTLLLREILPNTLRPLAVEFGLRLSYAVLFMSSLSFLGIGIQPPAADWGSMVRENLSGLYYGAPAAIVPAVLIGVLVVGLNFTVDWASGGADRSVSDELR